MTTETTVKRWQDRLKERDPHQIDHQEVMSQCVEAEITELRAQVAQYQKGHERWQFWRARYSALCTEHCARRAGIDLTSTYVNTPEKMDAVTDAAIDKARGK